MSVTINLTEGNKVTIKRQDPISLTLEKKAASSVSITQQANVAISLQNKAPSFISIIKPGFSGSVTLWGGIAGTITNQTDLVDYIAEQIADIPTPATPTLQIVTDEGATTTNTIQVDGLTVTGAFKNYDEATPDIGAKQDNDLRGYGDKYISNKTIAYSRIGSAAFDEEGAIRIKDNVFQTYIGGAWQDVVTNFRFREDENGNFELEHKPIGFTGWIEVNSGNSDLLGLNGLPITQNYATSMGAYPVPLTLDGGTF